MRAIEIMNEFNTGTNDDDVNNSGVTSSSEDASFASLVRFKQWWTRRNERKDAKDEEEEESKLKQQLVRLKLNPDFPSPLVVEAFTRPNVSRDPAPPSWGIPDLDGIRDFALDYIKWGRWVSVVVGVAVQQVHAFANNLFGFPCPVHLVSLYPPPLKITKINSFFIMVRQVPLNFSKVKEDND